ncbi:MAG: TonB-dependent receptor [Rhodothermales bacterium]|nr:TonB-dependent receptor [Rhodothermales bacterium]
MRFLPFLLAASALWANPHAAAAQETASLSGFIRDAATGETLLLANLVVPGTSIGTATNTSGYYTLTGLTPGDYTLRFSYIGYRDSTLDVALAPGDRRRLDIDLYPEEFIVGEVVVTARRQTDEEVRSLGVAQMKTDLVRAIPAILEADVFRSLQLLPGVKAASDYSSGLYVRGGSPDQTLILLDRTTVYNPSHFFGFFSTFNPDAVKDVRLYKGGYPAEYGGRLGAVVDIYNKDGNRNQTQGRVSLGLLASRAIVEGPYRRGSWMLAVRRSTLEPLLAVLQNQDIDGIPDKFHFIDANGKFNVDISGDDRLSLSFYAGEDKLLLPFLDDASIDLSYGNRTLSANWTHIFSERLFSNFTLTSSRYFSRPEFEIAGTPITRSNNVYDQSLKADVEYMVNDRHQIRAGFWSGIFTFRLRDEFDGEESLFKRIQSPYSAFYVEDIFRPTPAWKITGGVRGNYFAEGNYLRLEPRIGLEHQINRALRLQVGYGRYYQFLTLITNELFTGSDIWLTTAEGVPPAYGDQYVAGLKSNVLPGLNVDFELYYRTMQDLFELDPRIPDVSGLDYDELFRFGQGYAYGAEVFVEKRSGRLNGYVGYTFGITRRRFPDFPDPGQFDYYPPKYDRTHDVNAVATYRLSKRWSLTGVWSMATGQAYTRPRTQYRIIDNPLGSQVKNALVSPFNADRLPSYQRLDIGASLFGRFFRIADYELQLQVLNVYNRRNVWFYFFDFEDDDTVKREEVPMIPVPIPNISFTLSF